METEFRSCNFIIHIDKIDKIHSKKTWFQKVLPRILVMIRKKNDISIRLNCLLRAARLPSKKL